MSPKRKSASKKAAAKRKHRAAGIKAAAKRKHRAAGKKAAKTRVRKAAAKKAAITRTVAKMEIKEAPAAAPAATITTAVQDTGISAPLDDAQETHGLRPQE